MPPKPARPDKATQRPALEKPAEAPSRESQQGQRMSYWARRMRKYAAPPDASESGDADDSKKR